ncbi:VTT domain-containing protein [bacterium]|nr:VTT domain-containing protein [bacterium]
MDALLEQFEKLRFFLFTPEGLQAMILAGGYAILIAIVFAETGLFVGFFLPGDSLLFVAGFVAGLGHLDFWTLNIVLSVAAIVGDTVGYWIGHSVGAAFYDRPDSMFFKRRHLIKTHEFYERHGGKTIVLARFVPIVRTFAPLVAGIAKMKYSRFLSFNVFGGIFWVFAMTGLGYKLGAIPWVRANLEKAVLIVIFISILPMIIEYWRHKKSA